MKRKIPFIEFLDRKNRGKRIYLTKKNMSIGRADITDIVVDSSTVSRTHAFIIEEQGKYFIIDNQSKNGLRINGKIRTHSILNNNDFIEIGDLVFKFVENSIRDRVHYNLLTIFFFVGGVGLITGYFLLNSFKTSDDTVELLANVVPSNEEEEFLKKEPSNPIIIVKDKNEPQKPHIESVIAEKKELIKLPTGKKKSKNDLSLKIVLSEGYSYLKEGDFDSAQLAFGFALLISPQNELAKRGLELAKARSSSVEDIFKTSSTEKISQNNKALVDTLLAMAEMALLNKHYQKAIDTAEKVRNIELPGETRYLNRAKQIIDKAKIVQKEEFEPFMEEARNLIKNKAYSIGRELCREMLRKDNSYTPAEECMKITEKYLKND